MDNQLEPNWNSTMDVTPPYVSPDAAAASVVALDGDVCANGGGSAFTRDNEQVGELTMDNPPELNDCVALYDGSDGRGPAEVLELKNQIKTLGAEPFAVGSIYESFDALKGELHSFAISNGFTISRQGFSLKCSRGVKPRHAATVVAQKKRKIATWKYVECQFQVNFQYSISRKKGSSKIMDGSTPDQCVKITYADLEHCDKCCPSAEQKLACHKASGYLFHVNNEKVADVITLLNTTAWVPANVLRGLLKPLLPIGTAITAQDLVNFRLWAKANTRRLQGGGHNIALTRSQLGSILAGKATHHLASNHLSSMSALTQCGEILSGIVADTLKYDGGTWQVERYLSKLKMADATFDYRISYDDDGHATGIVWQTGAMRAAFNNYGQALFLDAMKRQLNNLDWPYIATALIDGWKKVCIGSEAIICGELENAYVWIVQCTVQMADGRRMDEIHSIFGDCFVQPTLLEKLGITTTCKLFWDHFHLLQQVWPEYFGKENFHSNLKSGLETMCHANSVQDFDAGLLLAQDAVRTDPTLFDYLEKFGKKREMFANYCVANSQWTLGRRGSSHAEQNHWSVQSFLGPVCYEDPCQELKNLLERHAHLCSKRNVEIAKYKMQCVAADITGNMGSEDLSAKQSLSSWGYELWKKESALSKNYEYSSSDGFCLVWNKSHPEKKRTLLSGERCNCASRIGFHIQCRHEIKIKGGVYDFSLFAARWNLLPRLAITPRATASDSALPQAVGQDHENENDGLLDVEDGKVPAEETGDICEIMEDDFLEEEMEPTNKKKVSYSTLMEVSKLLSSCAVAKGVSEEVLGILHMVTQHVKDNQSFNHGDCYKSAESYSKAFLSQQPVQFLTQESTTYATQDDVDDNKENKRQRPLSNKGIWTKAPIKRLKGKAERAMDYARKGNSNRTKTCSFCRLEGHNKAKCSVMMEMGQFVRNPVDLACQINDHQQFPGLQLQLDNGVKLPITSVPKQAKSICIHGLYLYSSKGFRVAKLSVYGDGGIALPGYNEHDNYYTVECVTEWMVEANRSSSKHVFSGMTSY
jgi:hypothetical protein